MSNANDERDAGQASIEDESVELGEITEEGLDGVSGGADVTGNSEA